MSALGLAVCVLAASARASEPRLVTGSGPSLALEMEGPAGPSETFAVDPDLPVALRGMALEETVRVAGWPVAPGDRRTVELTRHDVYAPDARIVAIGKGGETEVPRSRLVFFWGTAVGDPSHRVSLSLDPETGRLGGLGVTPDGVFEVRAAGRQGEYRIASSSEAQLAAAGRDAATDGFTCGGSPSAPEDLAPSAAVPPGAATSTLSSLHTTTVAVDTDNELLSLKFADSTAGAANYLASLFAGMNVIYERDLFVRLLQGHTILRLSSAADPWTQPGCPAWPAICRSDKASGAQLTELSNYWAANYAAVPRGLAMMVSGKQTEGNHFSGTAWLNGLCSGSVGYSFSQVFKFGGSTVASDVPFVGHELGHNFGSRHTHCYPTAAAPIDACHSGESGCYNGPTSCPAPFSITPVNGSPVVNVRGTIMSYCHLLGCPVSAVFHPQTVDVISPFVDGKVGVCVFPNAGATNPTLSTVVPSSGLSTGGTTITLTGTGFQSGATVTFLDASKAVAATSVAFVSSTTLTAVTPAHATGLTDVVVGNPTKRSATKGGGFAFTLRPQPVWHPFFAVDALETPYVGDFNGDGKADIITFARQNPSAFGDVYVAVSNGSQFVDKNGTPGRSDKWHDFFAINTSEQVVIGDYDGDGKDDIATWLGATTRQVYVALSLGTGMGPGRVWLGSIGFNSTDVLQSGDVNGDGKKDLILFARTQGKVYVALSDGAKFGNPTQWHGFFAVSTYERPRVADVTGDGRADIVTFATDSPTAFGDVYVATSDGTRFVDLNRVPDSSSKWHDWFAIRPEERVQVGDLDGDGREDFFTFLPPPFAQCYTVLSQGAGMGPNVLWREAVAPLSGDVPLVGDANGDGKADIILFAQSEGKVYVSLAP